MRCPRCNAENREQAGFCSKCGAALALLCLHCGAALLPEARFCDACGATVSATAPPPPSADALVERLLRQVPKEYAERLLATRGQPHDERRTVTILFSDVKGSTAMAANLDPEEVKEIILGAFEFLVAPIYRYEGTLVQLMGDAILAFFGAPIAHEDDPERACRAALDITAEAAEYAEKLEKQRGIKGFDVRVGINTGLVVVGEVGTDLRVAYTAIGDAINLAARMEQNAEPGTVLITEATHKLIAPLFETQAVGPLQVKGKAEPVQVYRVLAPKAAAGKVRGIAGLESPLVGREAEFAALQDAIERLRAGVGGIVTIVGEAGLGKSRLVAEIRAGATRQSPLQHAGPAQWVEGRCLSYGTSIAYLLWLDVLRELLGVSVEDSQEQVAERLHDRVSTLCGASFDAVFPYLARLLSLPLDAGAESRLRDLGGQQLKANTFCAVETVIQCAANQRPLVLVCEDLHWADPTSLQLLERLLPLTQRAALLLICLLRPVQEHPSWPFLATLAQNCADRHTALTLEPLSPADSQSLVSNLLGVENLPQVLRERILSRAEGNPFYVEEVIRSLIDRGDITRDEASGAWMASGEVATIAIPDTLQGVLMARIDRLQADTKRVLQLAAVVGRIFLYRVLQAIAEEQRTLDDQLLLLQNEEMIRERARLPELEYIFKHELTREAAYNGLLKKERRTFHRQVAMALERLFPERIEEMLGLLAHHWERTEESEKAIVYLLRAGDQARLAYAHQEAIDYYQRALASLKEQTDYERAARTLMKLGLTYHTAFDYAQSRQAYEEGFALWQMSARALRPDLPLAPHAFRQLVAEPLTLDPNMVCEETADPFMHRLFSGLVECTPEQDVVPDAARSWEVLEGGRTYIFHLREDGRWGDGMPVTAHDFEYAWKRVLDPATGSQAASMLYDVKGARAFHQGEMSHPQQLGVWALDDLTLAVELEGPTGYFLYLLATSATYPVPRHAVQAYGKAWAEPGRIVTNGPWRLESWERGKLIALARNPGYRGRFPGNLQRLELAVAPDKSEWLKMYEADRLDTVNIGGLPRTERDIVRQRHAGEYISSPGLSTPYFGFDVRRPPFDDRRVRQAFVLATDREKYVNVVEEGCPFPPTGGFVPLGIPGHAPGIALTHGPEQARQLLAEAGYAGGRGFPLVDAVSPGWEKWAEYSQATWRETLGVEITWQSMDWAAYVERMQTRPPHLFLFGWYADYPDPDNFLRVGLPWQETGWHNEAYERLIEEGRRVMDQAARMELYRRAEGLLAEEAPIVPLFYGRSHQLRKPWVKGPTSGLWYKYVVIEPH